MSEHRVQRRLAAILAADVVGYSRLIEADEEGTRARLRSLQAEIIDPRVGADGGRVVKTMGDGFLVEFSSAVDAVRNALGIQGAIARRNADVPEDTRMELRIGINVGDVIVEGDDIHGDGVNVAARLEEFDLFSGRSWEKRISHCTSSLASSVQRSIVTRPSAFLTSSKRCS